MKPREEVKREFVRQWLRKADADLETARHLVATRPDLAFAAAYHAQQAAEKSIKASLVWLQVEFPKTHDLDRLVALVQGSDPGLGDRLHEARLLTPYGVDARYPGDLPEPEPNEVREAVEIAVRIRRVIAAALPAFLATPGG
jgi:HEPN domain-containing protein